MAGVASSPKGSTEVWPLWKLILIALPQVGVQTLWCFIGPNSAPYMLHLGMGPALATLNNVAGPITGFFTGPLVGATSDRCTSRFGRRRPVILVGLASTWVAGMLFSAAEHIFSGRTALYFAAPMFWVMDVTINILQNPHRALVADLASEDQQVPMQVVFVFMIAIGNFLAFSIMQIYKVPVEHMFELMFGICALNTLCVGIQFLVARETPLKRHANAPAKSVCAPVADVIKAARGSPFLLYHLAVVYFLVATGATAWSHYGEQWLANSVYGGSQDAPSGSAESRAYADGIAAFGFGGQCGSVLQLASALVIIGLLLKTTIRPRAVYAPCIFVGALASTLAAFAVGHRGSLAVACMAASVLPATGSLAIPFGFVAAMNQRAQAEGREVSTALQMALLNCCGTLGQQVCTMALAAVEGQLGLRAALPCVFMLAAVAHALGGTVSLLLDTDGPGERGAADGAEGGRTEYSRIGTGAPFLDSTPVEKSAIDDAECGRSEHSRIEQDSKQ